MNYQERIFSVLTEGGKGMMDRRRVKRFWRAAEAAPKNSPIGKKNRWRALYQAKAERAAAAFPEEPRSGGQGGRTRTPSGDPL